jgi:fibrillarin-like rRNA methylase
VLPGANSLLGGDIYDCKNSEWVQLRQGGYRVWNPGRSDGGTTYTASGAITIQPGVQFLGSAARWR